MFVICSGPIMLKWLMLFKSATEWKRIVPRRTELAVAHTSLEPLRGAINCACANRQSRPTNQRGLLGERACGRFKRRVARKSVTTSQSWFKCVSHCYENAWGLPTRRQWCLLICWYIFFSFPLGIFRITESRWVKGHGRHSSGDVRYLEVASH